MKEGLDTPLATQKCPCLLCHAVGFKSAVTSFLMSGQIFILLKLTMSQNQDSSRLRESHQRVCLLSFHFELQTTECISTALEDEHV